MILSCVVEKDLCRRGSMPRDGFLWDYYHIKNTATSPSYRQNIMLISVNPKQAINSCSLSSLSSVSPVSGRWCGCSSGGSGSDPSARPAAGRRRRRASGRAAPAAGPRAVAASPRPHLSNTRPAARRRHPFIHPCDCLCLSLSAPSASLVFCIVESEEYEPPG